MRLVLCSQFTFNLLHQQGFSTLFFFLFPFTVSGRYISLVAVTNRKRKLQSTRKRELQYFINLKWRRHKGPTEERKTKNNQPTNRFHLAQEVYFKFFFFSEHMRTLTLTLHTHIQTKLINFICSKTNINIK